MNLFRESILHKDSFYGKIQSSLPGKLLFIQVKIDILFLQFADYDLTITYLINLSYSFIKLV